MTPRFLPIALFGVLGAFPLAAQQAATITVDAKQVLGPVNRLVFGHNIEAGDSSYLFTSNTSDRTLIERGGGFWDPSKPAPVPEVVHQSKAVGMSVLRYPGGCLVHNFDWRQTVGPDAKQRKWLFGLDEYLHVCQAIGAVPLVVVSDYALPADQLPQHAAALIEYLNAPADGAHPWALKRQAWGHPAPYNVRWFELGNESVHGNHRIQPHRQYTAEQYAAYVNATAAAMRAVDPNIKLGVLMIPGPGTDVNSSWNRTVIHQAGASADFVILHVYAPQQLPTNIPDGLHLQAMMATPQQVEEHLLEYHQMIRKELGHDLPLAITEFNGGLDATGSSFRFSYANALECADLLRLFLQPDMNIALASYWQFLNGYFGMLRTTVASTDGKPETEEPSLKLYRLWHDHFGSQLIKTTVQSPRADFSGAGSEMAAKGISPEAKRQLPPVDLSRYSSAASTLWPKLLNVQIERQNADLKVRVQNLNQSLYPLLAQVPRPGAETGAPVAFAVSFEAQFTPDPGSSPAAMGIGLMDSRGWSKTHSGIGVDDITTVWNHFEATYPLAADTPSVDLTVRLMGEGKHVSGILRVHNLVLTEFVSGHDAAYPLLTSSASLSSDGKKAYLIVLNKSVSDAVPGSIRVAGFSPGTAHYWEINSPDLKSGTTTETGNGASLPASGGSAWNHSFPAHSMTAIEFDSNR